MNIFYFWLLYHYIVIVFRDCYKSKRNYFFLINFFSFRQYYVLHLMEKKLVILILIYNEYLQYLFI
jgi:hypothetical protein